MKVEWRDVWIGAIVTAVLFEVGKFLIGLYIGKQGLESTFGAAASFAALLLWLYYTAQIFLFGAELTACLGGRQDRQAEKRRELAEPNVNGR